jgi:hypothetical protein
MFLLNTTRSIGYQFCEQETILHRDEIFCRGGREGGRERRGGEKVEKVGVPIEFLPGEPR